MVFTMDGVKLKSLVFMDLRLIALVKQIVSVAKVGIITGFCSSFQKKDNLEMPNKKQNAA